MKNRVIKNFVVFLFFWTIIVIGINLFQGRNFWINLPWEVYLIFLLSLLQLTTNLSKKVISIIDFIFFFLYTMINSSYFGYVNWTSLVIFAIMALFFTAITLFIGNQFKKGDHR
ncbi:hypothetical protein [Companilactobacillus pabuli]|jgi:hypothetical protein|uniref:Uncharacterized protein n=1 Tax=Companilactobacillus pabuli TaxID=2714036 RepID=A0A7L7KUP0_9LACO|nr:hypothetical protein [Companilactobacillus pabuli]AKP03419.1 hypothetical protein ABB45_07165 [Companilactobacillus farciminis]AKS51722.1 hypothetical protein ABB44_07180 [Companilactobacillus farciminis]MDG5112536.1 hypothetical protein [Companilactobacillus pabuli]QMT83507.1 hypothetical protein G6534_02060 [Companilactobacillus pabuli]GAQ01210.1 hypothetical protein NBRC111452_1011 [Companilactobacillus farciminis]